MKSGQVLATARVGLMWSANLIANQGIVNVFHQGVNPLHPLRVVEEICNIILDPHQLLANLLQFPGNPSFLGVTLNFGENMLTALVHLLSLSLSFSH